MENILLIAACLLVAYSGLVGGRSNFPAVQEGNGLDRFFVRVQLSLNFISIPLAAVLPVVTAFKGQPWLAYATVVLVTTALLVYPVQLPAWRFVAPSMEGKRSVAPSDIRRTRWPYRTLFVLGNLTLLIYAFTFITSTSG
ncbi:hypothetical protein I6N91_15980 [Arthrobacter sp. MSA 4-2]|uniref:hypothetical protein n=1 Tax=Arthrobacter sp. MSA 4-2 TaxID=2794349 RepID=UPI0018E7BA52|nr:hypothetical protein [Arthrobacter sp. MSA 4-2]MBJ2122480.1 hypothetical protein [Arthrobacter sp. MSA 4-2]